jgi:hypothetical protein
MTDQTVTEHPWIATEATVTTCRYQSPALSILAFGFQTGERFRITIDYYAHGRLYSSEFQSSTAIPQNERLPITYNPLHPEQNSRNHGPAAGPVTTRSPLVAIAIMGSVILSLLWLAILHSCR